MKCYVIMYSRGRKSLFQAGRAPEGDLVAVLTDEKKANYHTDKMNSECKLGYFYVLSTSLDEGTENE